MPYPRVKYKWEIFYDDAVAKSRWPIGMCRNEGARPNFVANELTREFTFGGSD